VGVQVPSPAPFKCKRNTIMQVTETLSEGLKRGYEIKLTSKELDKKVTEDLMAAQPDMEMKGFRKGKVPLALMKKKFGEQVTGEAMQKKYR